MGEEEKEFEPITTEEALTAIVNREKSAVEKKYADSLEALKKTANTYKTQLEESQGKLQKLELDNLKTKVALEAGLPVNLRDRLQGTDEESLKNDAKALVKLIGKSSPPLRSNEPEIAGDEKTMALKKIIRNLREKEI